jgi:hypothetical protein
MEAAGARTEAGAPMVVEGAAAFTAVEAASGAVREVSAAAGVIAARRVRMAAAPIAGVDIQAGMAAQPIGVARALTAEGGLTEVRRIAAAVPLAGLTAAAEATRRIRERADFRVVARRGLPARVARSRTDSGIPSAAAVAAARQAQAGQEKRGLARIALRVAALRAPAEASITPARQWRTANGTPSALAAAEANSQGGLVRRRAQGWRDGRPLLRAAPRLTSWLLAAPIPQQAALDSAVRAWDRALH